MNYTLQDIKLRIQDDAAKTHAEIGYVVLMTADGRIVVIGPMTQNDENGVDFRIPRADARYIIAFVHNHPTGLYGTADVLNRSPSPIDWNRFDSVASMVTAAGGNGAALQEIILGPDNQLRSYDASSPRDGTASDPI